MDSTLRQPLKKTVEPTYLFSDFNLSFIGHQYTFNYISELIQRTSATDMKKRRKRLNHGISRRIH